MKQRRILSLITALALFCACAAPALGEATFFDEAPVTGLPVVDLTDDAYGLTDLQDGTEGAMTDLHAPTAIVILEPESATLLIGESLKLEVSMTAMVEPVVTKLTWRSGDRKIASVDKNGVVTGLGPGQVTITVRTANGLKARMALTIADSDAPVEAIDLPGDDADAAPENARSGLDATVAFWWKHAGELKSVEEELGVEP